ncbi:MAG: RluA family pseudouridine synthase [Bacillota bacterium]|nr:RluA family pseudouridine synthase [Bacillota bacterium]
MILNNESGSLKIKITRENENNNILDFLIKDYNFSQRLLRRLKKSNSIFLNGKSASVRETIFCDDILEILFEDEKLNYEPEKMNLKILYEDGDILIVDKEPFMVVHPTKTHLNNTLANGIADYFIKNNIKKRIRFVNRLDMNTSGIIIIAKNSYAHQYIQNQMQEKTIKKKYIAILTNSFPYDEGIIELPIGKLESGDIKRKVFDGGKDSITIFKTLESFKKNGAVVEIDLKTGRTHQIRVHFSHYNNSLLGDDLYGVKSSLIDRQALHSFYLRIKVPREKDFIEINSDLPDDMKKVITKLRDDNYGI